jgi:hypothetical protein
MFIQMEVSMFFAMVLFLVGAAAMIGTPIAHSMSYFAYEKASKAQYDAEGSEDSREKLRTGFLQTAVWMQFVCYILGVFAAICFIWCGITLGAMIKV